MSDKLPPIFVSPAEPAVLRGLGLTSPVTERYGVDFLWRAREQWFGAQRKELKDLLASASDGRLAKEIGQMRGMIAMPLVIVEGNPKFTTEGVLAGVHQPARNPWTEDSIFNLFMSIRNEGTHLMFSASMRETAWTIERYVAWSVREHHSMKTRGAAFPERTNAWGTLSNRDFQLWFLQGLPDVGPKLAAAILDHFGRVPLTWDKGVDVTSLSAVPGIGVERARKILSILRTGERDHKLAYEPKTIIPRKPAGKRRVNGPTS